MRVKKCKFCVCHPEQTSKITDFCNGGELYIKHEIWCINCGIEIWKKGDTRKKAQDDCIKSWNKLMK